MIELPEEFIEKPFDIYPDREKTVKYMQDFVSFKMPKSNWCTYIYGQPGAGKSALAAASLKSFFLRNKCVSGIFLSTRSYFKKLRDSFGENIAMSNLMDKLENTDLLVFDDFGTGVGSEWELSKISDLLEARFDKKAKTIITSNFDLETLKAKMDDRLYRRIKEGGIINLKKSEWHGQVPKDIERPRMENLSKPVQPHQYKDDDGI